MMEDLIVNIAILIAFIFFWHQMFTTRRLTFNSPIWVKMADGVLGGFLGIILMHFSIYVNDITILDLRHIPVVIVAYYGGIIPPLIAAAIISVGRYMIDINISSHASLVMMFVIALGSGLISYYVKMINWKKWLVLLFYSQTIFSIALYIVAPDYSEVVDAAILHIVFSICGGFIAFYFVRYVRKNSEMLLTYKEYARIDTLTGLYNVRTFHHYYEKYIKLAKEEQVPFVLMMLDIDHFKEVNDTHGHMAGDEVLKQLADLFKREAGKDARVTRNGGDEFAILYSGKALPEVREIAERIRNKVKLTPFILPTGKAIHLTISIGLAQYHPSMENDHILYQIADDALYHAKSSGRNLIEMRFVDLA
ncbi:diguanylate cyclase [Bacillaceae bacterium W0354]